MTDQGEKPAEQKPNVKVRVIEKLTNFPLPEMVTVPGGEFLMGTSEEQVMQLCLLETWAIEWREEGHFYIEMPMHYVDLPPFKIGKFPVTNKEYHAFIWDSNYRIPKGWVGFRFPEGLEKHPVVGINWVDANEYCKWLAKKTKLNYRLPNEAEWERAARGVDGRIYPWGDAFDPWRCNTLESGIENTVPVDTYMPSGVSPSGTVGMSGNVWEWTSSHILPYPFHLDPAPEEANAIKRGYVIRGGAWYYSKKLARCAAREVYLPDYVSPAMGFRVALSI
jgi:toxoflavin biosynthesis protein ToxD